MKILLRKKQVIMENATKSVGRFISGDMLIRIDDCPRDLVLDALETRRQAYDVHGRRTGWCGHVKYKFNYQGRPHVYAGLYMHPFTKTKTLDLEFNAYEDIPLASVESFDTFIPIINYFQTVDKYYGTCITALYVSALVGKIIGPKDIQEFNKRIAEDCQSYINFSDINKNVNVGESYCNEDEVRVRKILCLVKQK